MRSSAPRAELEGAPLRERHRGVHSGRRLRELDEELAALRAASREGRAEVARGEGIPLDEVLAEFDTPDAE